jgi:hypothetical protein
MLMALEQGANLNYQAARTKSIWDELLFRAVKDAKYGTPSIHTGIEHCIRFGADVTSPGLDVYVSKTWYDCAKIKAMIKIKRLSETLKQRGSRYLSQLTRKGNIRKSAWMS